MMDFSGHLELRAERRPNGQTVLAHQAFRAPFHLSKPYWDADARTLLVQVVNPTAGILARDHLESDIQVGPGAALMVTTPSASRVFLMRNGSARSRQRFTVQAGGWLEVCPEPLVPHRGSRFAQQTELEVAPDAAALFVDSWMPGRLAHGDAWAWDQLELTLSVRRGGNLSLRERFCQSGPELRRLGETLGAGDTTCFANAVVLLPSGTGAATEAPAWRTEIAALHTAGLWVGVTEVRPGIYSLRFIAADPLRLRDALRATRRHLVSTFPHLACDARKL